MEITVGNEVTEALSRLLLEKSTNRQITAWIEDRDDFAGASAQIMQHSNGFAL